VRLNELQIIGTHNSYHREISEREQAAYEAALNIPGDYDAFLAYSHATLPQQFERQGVRGLELDLFGDPQGGLYAEPLIRRVLGLGALPDPAWRAPGIKVLHIPDADYRTTCVQLVACLRQVREWSLAHPRHVPIPIMLELKRSDSRVVAAGGVVAPAWDAAALDALDAEIRSVFAEDEMITPDDVRQRGSTLEQSVLRHGWPRLRDSRGQVMFLLDNDPGAIRDAYVAGRPNLEARVVFTNARPGFADAAFIKRNEPRGTNTAQIADLVRRGYYVRTRSDVPLQTVIANDTSMLDAALASGAQLISTDFPQIGMSARYDNDLLLSGGPGDEPASPSMRSGPRVPASVSSRSPPRSRARPGCTTIPAGADPGSRTTSSRLREYGLTSDSVEAERLANRIRLESVSQAGVPRPGPAARRRTRPLPSRTSAPAEPPARAPTASRVRPGDPARCPPAPRGSLIARERTRRAPGEMIRSRPRALTSVRPPSAIATPTAPGTRTRRSSRRRTGSTIATRPPASTTAASRPSWRSAIARPSPRRSTDPSSRSVRAFKTRSRRPWTAYSRRPSREIARPSTAALPYARRAICVRSLTSSATIVLPAAT